jgi:hypothetical protein
MKPLFGRSEDNVRAVTHHVISSEMDRKTQTMRYHTGKGGTGAQQTIDYGVYLARSCKLFLQAMTLLRVEIMMCHASGARPPLV